MQLLYYCYFITIIWITQKYKIFFKKEKNCDLYICFICKSFNIKFINLQVLKSNLITQSNLQNIIISNIKKKQIERQKY